MTIRILTGILAIATLVAAVVASTAAQTPVPVPDVAQRYTLDATFDPDTGTIAGQMVVDWTNTTGEPQGALPFRLYPNADHYGEGGISLDGVTVDGLPAGAEGTGDPTVMRVPLGRDVVPGEHRELTLAFTTTIPIDSPGSFGMFRGNSADGSWSLVNWYPIVAGWEPGEGWNLVPAVHGVDPTFVTASAWDVTITHPARYTLVATGQERTEVDGDRAVTSIRLDPGRELAVVALPAGDIVETTTRVDGVTVAITLPRVHDVPGMREALEGAARAALPRYTSWFGIPAGDELDLTTADLDQALGVSWTDAIWLDLAQLTADGVLQDVERESLTLVVYHEIAHQWMANRIGVDSNDHTFLSEAMANVLTVAVVRDVDGAVAAERAFAGFVAGPYRAFVNGGQDAIADTPASQQNAVVHSIVSYGKGGVGFEAIRQQVGDDAFFEALAALAGDYSWGIVAPDAVLTAFERDSGQELDTLWSFWFEEAGATTVADVDAVIAAAGK